MFTTVSRRLKPEYQVLGRRGTHIRDGDRLSARMLQVDATVLEDLFSIGLASNPQKPIPTATYQLEMRKKSKSSFLIDLSGQSLNTTTTSKTAT
jgi:hypothetical protein